MALAWVLMGLLLLDREGAAMDIKDRILKGDDLMDSFEGDSAVIPESEEAESETGPVTVESGSIKQVFFNMAGRSFFSNDLVFPVRSSTGKFKQGSISE